MTDKGEFRGIYVALVDDPEFQDLSADARAVFYPLKLKLGKSGIAVFYEESLPRLTGMPSERVRDAIRELSEANWLHVERNVFWLRNGLRYDPSNPLQQPNHRKAIEAHLTTLPKLQIVNDFAVHYGLVEPFDITPKRAPEPMPSGCHSDAKPITDHGIRNTDDGEQKAGASAALVPVEPVQGEWSHDPQAPLPTQELIGAWVKHYEKRNGRRPPGKDIPKQGAAAKRICDGHTAEEVVYAFLGIDHLFPYSKGEPWDLFDLEKKFTKAMAAAQDHPDIKRQREEAAFMEAIGHREAA
jgi:hypothetical protein